MKHKISVLLFILLLFSELNGNVVFPGAYIEEIYFDGDCWTIELLNIFVQEETLDNCKIASSSDTSLFNPGIYFPLFGYTLITQNSLQSQLNINKNGDMVATYYPFVFPKDWYLIDECCFGNFPDSWINSPNTGQSLARITILDTTTGMSGKILTKDNSPTLGMPNDTTGTKGTFCGYVYDNQGNPINGVELKFFYPYYSNYFPVVTTDGTGHFSQRMFSLNYETFILVDGSVLMDTTITVEPDSTTYCEFYINLNSVDEEQLQSRQLRLTNYPNPFIESTTISFSAADLRGLTQIRIYNIKGQKIKTLECGESLSTKAPICRNYSISWDGKNESDVLQPPGFYFYSLEVDGKKVKTNKMIMVR